MDTVINSERFHALKLGHQTERLSMISGWREGEVVALMLFKGYCNTELVCQWFEEFLLPELLPNQILEVIFLPPYSPDLNKIEKFWARLKNYVRKIIVEHETLSDAVS